MKEFCRCVLITCLIVRGALAQGEVLEPPRSVVLDGAPKIPASISQRLERYEASSADSMVGWDPVKVEPIIARQPSNIVGALYRVQNGGGSVQQIRRLPSDTYDICLNRARGYLVFWADMSSGAERMQLYRSDLGPGSLALLTDGKSTTYSPIFSNSGDRLMYSSNRRDGKHMDVYMLDPLDPKSDHMVAQLDGEEWAVVDWSPDDRKVILLD